MRRLLPWLLAALLLLETGVAVGLLLPHDPDESPSSGRYEVGVQLGGGASFGDAVRAFCRLVGIRPATVMSFHTFAEPLLYADEEQTARELDVTPMVTWEPVDADGRAIPLAAIAAGEWDGYLERSARQVAAFGRPVLVRFAHEMNLATSPVRSAGSSPRDFVAAWRHVVTVFRDNRAGAAQFVWSPNVDCDGKCPFTAYFPGDHWVDWAGLDGYNEGGPMWRSLAEVFTSSYDTLTRLTSRPLMIAETASAETGGSKADWIRDGLTKTVPVDFPRVGMVVWFDRDKETDWRVNSSRQSLAAFRSAVRSPAVSAARADGRCTKTSRS